MALITASLDVTKIKKEWLFVGRNGAKYLNIALLESHNNEYGNSHMVVQSVPKELKQENPDLRGPILGNAKTFQNTGHARREGGDDPEPKKVERELPPEDDDVPF